ncbi:hypothetical protein VOLCADRAFT_105703 [Volvox carteri f. nagariensis]|uniref:Small ubiquitin-related modifier n=1 Tax=Volvox carteri f. nagariensis TaxID=3068 RepID=D8U2G3_VOLCA|nr:uncharacterized protein VOLCADRAFT_105703 [Volvox carteri f. nagariensis]EFJ46058.1 hypothetical protein VOLCADRAFT_105703 [Volvox carteri f. nagariensis]|eukprot:XP_002952808.1 hypothetical protein VOLCADRAFT_105703 [Volvox carteri f. nagariensis]
MAEQIGENEHQKKPPFKEEGNPANVINLVVKDQTGNEVHFKVKMKTKLDKVFTAYCNKKGQDPSTVRFLYDGTRVHGHSTPDELGMEDGDVLDCVIEQLGGCCRA